jgi:hypothetical protein
MKTMAKRYYKIMTRLMISASTAFAGNNLAIVQTAKNTLAVQLSNSEDIYAVQFSLHTSSDVVLGKLERGSRTTAAHWLVASYKPNDSVVNVVIISMQKSNFSNGNGALAQISYTTENPNEISHASLTNVMITNSTADSLGIAINNLDWSNKSVFIAANNESNHFLLVKISPIPLTLRQKLLIG